MKVLHLLTLALVIVGGVNWGLVGAFGFDLVAAMLGADTALTRLVYIVVGAAALWQLVPLVQGLRSNEAPVLSGRPG